MAFILTHMLSFLGKFIGAVAGIAVILTLCVYFLIYSLDTSRDIRERKVRFDELVAQAEKLYCQNATGGAPVNIKIPLDRAADLETGIKDELVALDYLTLASVGANFWSHDKAHSYGMDGLRLAELTGDPIDIYSANLILGHIDFIEYRETKNEAYLHEARSHFQRAKEWLGNYPRAFQRHYFEGQLYLLWGTHEIYAGNREEGDRVIQLAAAAWQQLPQQSERLNRIGYAIQKLKQGIPPKLPCPSQIAVSPPYVEKVQPSEELVETTQSSPVLLEIGKGDSQQREGGSGNSLSERVGALEREVQSFVGSIPKRENRQSSDSESAQDSSQGESSCVFTVINNTNFEVWLYINGFDRDDFKLPAGSKRRFSVPCGKLTLYRREDSTTASWTASIFRNAEGRPVEPVIEISDCCMHPVEPAVYP